MADLLKPDLCVIGAGSGGLSVAAGAAMFGVPVVLVERGRMGGECLNVGCVPSKALIAAGDAAHAVRTAGRFGVVAPAPHVHFARVMAHVREVIAGIAPNDSVERFRALGVTVIQGEAAFVDRRTVRVGEVEIQPRRFVLATGSRPAVPDIPGVESVPFLTNETVFGLEKRPERLIVLGGGPMGVELAQAFRRLGSQVVLIQSGRLLPREDAEMAGFARRALLADGVELVEQAHVVRLAGVEGALAATLADGRVVEGTQLLIAAGRKPNVEALNLAAAGIAPDARGVPVNAKLKTANRRVYAIGDCASGAADGARSTHSANWHAGLVIRSALFRLPGKLAGPPLPNVVYCDPEIASVGLSEEEAARAGHKVSVLRWPFAENDRARAERAEDGLVKLVVDAKGRILGACVAGRGAGELIAPWAFAVAKGWRVRDMAGIVLPYPTVSEVSKRAAMSHFAPLAGKPWIRRILALLRTFG